MGLCLVESMDGLVQALMVSENVAVVHTLYWKSNVPSKELI